MRVAKVVALRQTPDARDDRPRAIACLQQLMNELPDCRAIEAGLQRGHLGSRQLEDCGADGMAFTCVGVEQCGRRQSVHDGGELPPEIYSIAYAGVEALGAHRRMDVCAVACQQCAPLAVGGDLHRAIGE